MAGQIIISNIKTDSDNAFSIFANTGAVLFSANLASGITTGIADGSVTNAKLAGSITGDKITVGTLAGNVFTANTITGDKIGQNSISSNNIATGAVAVSQLANTGDVRIQSISANTLSFYTSTIEALRIASNGDLRANSGYGSSWTSSTVYGCRAWVNFNGTGTPAIRASGNVSSITDNGTGDYTVNFTTAMPDANYSVAGAARYDGVANPIAIRYLGIVNNGSLGSDMSTSSVRVNIGYQNGLLEDPIVATVIIIR
jgi:hypothetical protein